VLRIKTRNAGWAGFHSGADDGQTFQNQIVSEKSRPARAIYCSKLTLKFGVHRAKSLDDDELSHPFLLPFSRYSKRQACELLAIGGGSRRCSGLGDDDKFERFSVGFEFNFIFVEGELDRCI